MEILNILCFETMKQTVDIINKRLGDKSPDISILLKSTNLKQWLQEESEVIGNIYENPELIKE